MPIAQLEDKANEYENKMQDLRCVTVYKQNSMSKILITAQYTVYIVVPYE